MPLTEDSAATLDPLLRKLSLDSTSIDLARAETALAPPLPGEQMRPEAYLIDTAPLTSSARRQQPDGTTVFGVLQLARLVSLSSPPISLDPGLYVVLAHGSAYGATSVVFLDTNGNVAAADVPGTLGSSTGSQDPYTFVGSAEIGFGYPAAAQGTELLVVPLGSNSLLTEAERQTNRDEALALVRELGENRDFYALDSSVRGVATGGAYFAICADRPPPSDAQGWPQPGHRLGAIRVEGNLTSTLNQNRTPVPDGPYAIRSSDVGYVELNALTLDATRHDELALTPIAQRCACCFGVCVCFG